MNIKVKLFGLVIGIFTLCLFGGFANQQITRVGVVDVDSIADAYFQDSKAYRDIEKLKGEYIEKIEEIKQEIKDLETKRLAAEDDKDESETLKLGEMIFNQTQYLKDYIRIQGGKLRTLQNQLSQSDEFLTELYSAIKIVAESDGYSLILDKSRTDILFWSIEVDVTEKVRKILKR